MYNRVEALTNESGVRFMEVLPEQLKEEILQYLFSDFLYKYKQYFSKLVPNKFEKFTKFRKNTIMFRNGGSMSWQQAPRPISMQLIE